MAILVLRDVKGSGAHGHLVQLVAAGGLLHHFSPALPPPKNFALTLGQLHLVIMNDVVSIWDIDSWSCEHLAHPSISRTVHTSFAHVFSHCPAQPGRGVNINFRGLPPGRTESLGLGQMRAGGSYSNGVLHRVAPMWRRHFPAIGQTILACNFQQSRYA